MNALPRTIGELARPGSDTSDVGTDHGAYSADLPLEELVGELLGGQRARTSSALPFVRVIYPDGERGEVAVEDLLRWLCDWLATRSTVAGADELTGLPGRGRLLDELDAAIDGLRRPDAAPIALLYFGLDGFRAVNETLGHHAGDLLLVEVARRLDETRRRNETVFRLSGDEFALLIDDAAASDPFQAADRLRRELREPWSVADQLVPLRASFGVAVAVDETVDAGEVLRRADVAMSAAKQSGRDCVRLWSDELDARYGNHLDLLTDLAEALEQDLLHLVYQPYFDLATTSLAGAEALVRWEHPERGTVYPDQFVPLAERSGMINTLGRWVLRTACKQAATWIDEGRLADGAVVSVNVSPPELMDTAFRTTVLRALAESGLSPDRLQLEITETAALDDTSVAAETLRRLRADGVRIAIDDFGTGYASMSYLRRLPVDAVKVDKSFVDHIVDEPRDAMIVAGIVQLADALALDVVAEGVESAEQATVLADLGCHKAQGYFFSRPQLADAFLAAVDRLEARST